MKNPTTKRSAAKIKSPANGDAAGGAKFKSSDPKFTRDTLAALQQLYGAALHRTGQVAARAGVRSRAYLKSLVVDLAMRGALPISLATRLVSTKLLRSA